MSCELKINAATDTFHCFLRATASRRQKPLGVYFSMVDLGIRKAEANLFASASISFVVDVSMSRF